MALIVGQVPVPYPVSRSPHREIETLLAQLESLLGLFALGDVLGHENDCLLAGSHGSGRQHDRRGLAVAGHGHSLDGLCHDFAIQKTAQLGLGERQRGARVDLEEVRDRPPDEIRFLHGEESARGRIDGANGAARLRDDEALSHRCDDVLDVLFGYHGALELADHRVESLGQRGDFERPPLVEVVVEIVSFADEADLIDDLDQRFGHQPAGEYDPGGQGQKIEQEGQEQHDVEALQRGECAVLTLGRDEDQIVVVRHSRSRLHPRAGASGQPLTARDRKRRVLGVEHFAAGVQHGHPGHPRSHLQELGQLVGRVLDDERSLRQAVIHDHGLWRPGIPRLTGGPTRDLRPQR